MRIGYHNPFLFGNRDPFLHLITDGFTLILGQIARVGLTGQDTPDRAFIPSSFGLSGRRSAFPSRGNFYPLSGLPRFLERFLPLKNPGRYASPLRHFPGLEPISPAVSGLLIAVGRPGADKFPRPALCRQGASHLSGHISGVKIIKHRLKRAHIVSSALLFAGVHPIVNGNIPNPFFREIAFHISSRLNIIPPEPGQVFGNHCFYLSPFDIPKQPLKPRPVKISTGIPVVNVAFRHREAVRLTILG